MEFGWSGKQGDIQSWFVSLFVLLLARGKKKKKKTYIVPAAVWKGKFAATEHPWSHSSFPHCSYFPIGAGPQLGLFHRPRQRGTNCIASSQQGRAAAQPWDEINAMEAPWGCCWYQERHRTSHPALILFPHLHALVLDSDICNWWWFMVPAWHSMRKRFWPESRRVQEGGTGSCRSHEGTSDKWRN